MSADASKAATERSARSQAQSERILAAARQCFSEHGFHGAGMALIAQTAQISPGLIYRYFASKSELIQGIVQQQMALLAADVQDLESNTGSPRERIMDIFRPVPENFDGRTHLKPALMLEITAEASRDPGIAKVLDVFSQQIDAAIVRWMTRPVSEGGFGVPPEQARQRALLLRALIDGLKTRQAREGAALDLDLLQQALDSLMPALMAAPNPPA